MNKLFDNKIENLYKNLLECYRDSSLYAPTISGSEREIFHSNMLAKILPSNYRVGTGTITDSSGRETGQVDLVIELPLSVSFPISSGNNRLYLADTVGAAFEVKSDLNKQWKGAVEKIKEIKGLNRYDIKPDDFALLNDLKIPTYIIAYKGFKKIDTIFEKIKDVPSRYWPSGIYIIESGLFVGFETGSSGQIECTSDKASVLGFISHLYRTLHHYAMKDIDLNVYSKLLK